MDTEAPVLPPGLRHVTGIRYRTTMVTIELMPGKTSDWFPTDARMT